MGFLDVGASLLPVAGAGLGGFLGGPTGAIAGASAGGAVSSAFGASEQQAASIKMAREQMDFQRKMSNTAHRRQVRDLKKAGLNPILSANSGASSPGGAMGTAQNISGAGAERSIAAAQAMASISNLEANTAKTQSEINPVEYYKQMWNSLPQGVKDSPLGKMIIEITGLTADKLNTLANTEEDPSIWDLKPDKDSFEEDNRSIRDGNRLFMKDSYKDTYGEPSRYWLR